MYTEVFSLVLFTDRTDWSRTQWEQQKKNITRRIPREEVFKQMLRLPNDGLTSIQAFQQGKEGKETALGWVVSLVLLAARIFKWSIYLKSCSLFMAKEVGSRLWFWHMCFCFQINVFTRKPPGKPTLRYAMLCLVAQSCPTLCNPMDRGAWQGKVHGDSPGKNTGVGCHAFLQGIFPTQGSNPGLLHCRQILYWLSHERSPSKYTEVTKRCIGVGMTHTGSPQGSLQDGGWEQGLHLLLLLLPWGRLEGALLSFKSSPFPGPLLSWRKGSPGRGTEPTEKAPSYTGHLSVGPGPPVSHRMSDHLGSLCFYCYTQGMEVPLDHAWHVFASRKDVSRGHYSSCCTRGLGVDV